MSNHEIINLKNIVKGEYIDTIVKYDADGNVIESIVTEKKSNIIVSTISTYMAGLIQGAYTGAYLFFALGTGSQTPTPSITVLVNEYTRQQAQIQFVDSNNVISLTPTNIILVSASWSQGQLGTVGLTEFGIFGGTNANLTNGGLMLDYVAHNLISIDPSIGISRKLYFTF